MGRISVLDELTINKIAAGEVVERPASVVKELLENSLDAGASHIRIQIENGGRNLIQILDDGCGMDRDDALLSLERHATSKIKDENDLDGLSTLGFRGEALPSIASVSDLLLETCAGGEGTAIHCEGGRIVSVNPAGLPHGTRITVRDLFYNMPARLKYLKSIPTEAGHIKESVSNLALANPNVSFTLHHKDLELLFTPGNDDPLQTIAAVFGSNVVKDVIAVEAQQGPMTLSGFIGKPEIAKPSRSHQVIILNGRWIRSRLISSAVEKAYHTYLPIARYPMFIVDIKLDPALVDVNVHPAKMEVRFSDESETFRQIYHSVRETLTRGVTTATWEHAPFRTPTTFSPPSPTIRPAYRPAQQSYTPLFAKEQAAAVEWIPAPRNTTSGSILPPVTDEAPVYQVSKNERAASYQVFDQTYIVTVEPDGIVFTDQHAAHERIQYERLIRRSEQGDLHGQLLLQPLVMELSPEEDAVMERATEVLNQSGFEIEIFGPSTVLLRGLPAEVSATDAERVFHEILSEFVQGLTGSVQSARDRIFAMLACRSAIKAGDSVGEMEIRRLMDDLAACQNPNTCPHGRPAQIKFHRDDILRMFRRI